jgi:hypothetical protein
LRSAARLRAASTHFRYRRTGSRAPWPRSALRMKYTRSLTGINSKRQPGVASALKVARLRFATSSISSKACSSSLGEKRILASFIVTQPGSSKGSILIEAVSSALLRPSSLRGAGGGTEPREKSDFRRPNKFILLIGSLKGSRSRENAENLAGRIRQTKAVWFTLRVAVGHKSPPALGSSDRLGGTGEDRRLLVDRNSVPKPFNSKHRRLQLPTTLANEMGGVGIRARCGWGDTKCVAPTHARSNSHADTSSKLLSVDEMSPAAGTHAAILPEGLRHVPLAALQLD